MTELFSVPFFQPYNGFSRRQQIIYVFPQIQHNSNLTTNQLQVMADKDSTPTSGERRGVSTFSLLKPYSRSLATS